MHQYHPQTKYKTYINVYEKWLSRWMIFFSFVIAVRFYWISLFNLFQTNRNDWDLVNTEARQYTFSRWADNTTQWPVMSVFLQGNRSLTNPLQFYSIFKELIFLIQYETNCVVRESFGYTKSLYFCTGQSSFVCFLP